MILWQDSNSANQKFTFKSAGNGKWGIFCAKNGLNVEINSNGSIICGQPNNQAN